MGMVSHSPRLVPASAPPTPPSPTSSRSAESDFGHAQNGIVKIVVTADFEAALARVKRANEHRETLWEMAAAHLHAYPIQKRFDVDDQRVRVVASATAKFPVEISIVFSEWLHNLRSALDATLYEVAVNDTGQDPPTNAGRRQFPIITDPERLEGPATSGLSEKSLEYISAMQPYHHTGGAIGSGLWWLHELARLDRHRRHHVFAWRFVELDMQADPGLFTDPIGVCASDRAFCVRWR